MKITNVHPLADLFPMMSKQELQALADDIKANGLREPIRITADGEIVDGRNRYKACEIAKVEPRFEQVNGDAGDLILSANIFRRHMTKGQIAILAVIAELEVELPKDSAWNEDAAPLVARGKKYDYQALAHRRVESLVSKRVVEIASHIVRWAPDHARTILDTGTGFEVGQREAEERSKNAHSEETRTRIMQEDSPELLAQVSDDGLSLAEAWRIREDRIRQERERKVRHTGYLVDRLTPLLGKSNPEELVEDYEPEFATRKIGLAELDEAIAYLKALRTAMVRAKKG
jgi:ParB-like chromosome segregation protein Spo0J